MSQVESLIKSNRATSGFDQVESSRVESSQVESSRVSGSISSQIESAIFIRSSRKSTLSQIKRIQRFFLFECYTTVTLNIDFLNKKKLCLRLH